MEKANESLELTKEESERVSRVTVPPHRVGIERSFFQDFILKGIRVDRIDPGLLVCTFKVPPGLTLSSGAIANLVDEIGGSLLLVEGLPMNVSIDMSISFLSTAKVDDELEITTKILGKRGGYSGSIVLIRNRAKVGIHCLVNMQASSDPVLSVECKV